MSFFPSCHFAIEFDGGAYRAGARNTGKLLLTLADDVPRAEAVLASFQGVAVAGYGSGKSRRVVRHTFFEKDLDTRLPPGGLRRGHHVFPFTVDVPASVTQTYRGDDCHVEHLVNVRLDVDWALDPTAELPLFPVPAPLLTAVQREPLVVRTPSTFHPNIAVELTLTSRVVAVGEPIEGRVALRSGFDVDFAALRIVLVDLARITMERGDVRPHPKVATTIPIMPLKAGKQVAFRIPTDRLPFEQHTGAIDLSSCVRIELDPGTFSLNRRHDAPILVVPPGTIVVGDAAPIAVGAARLGAVASTLASELGAEVGRAPVLLHGSERGLGYEVMDVTVGAQLAAATSIELPHVGLGLRLRAESLLARPTEETPLALRGRYVVKSEPLAPKVEKAHVRELLEQICAGLGRVQDLELSDHRIAWRETLPDDRIETWRAVATAAKTRAAKIAAAVDALPFAAPGHADERAWRAAAAEEGAVFVPSLPGILGITRSVRTLGGEPRRVVASIVTGWSSEEPWTRLEVRLLDVFLPDAVVQRAELREIASRFREVQVATASMVVALADGVPSDPRTYFDAIDGVLRWMLGARGERRVDAPYR